MEKVFEIYVKTTPERLWQAITDPDIRSKYNFGAGVDSDWKPGSKWEHRRSDKTGALDLVGKVVESSPPRRLVLTWAYPADAGREEKHSRVTFEIEPVGDVVRLTVTHEDLWPDMALRITNGWPRVLSSLKSFLETGRPLDVYA